MRSGTTDARTHLLSPKLLILDRRESVLGVAHLLTRLAALCGKPGAMHWLPYLLDEATLGRRSPVLVLALRPECNAAGALTAEEIEWAVLLFEYRVLGRGIGVFTTCDSVGFNGVLAPEGQRTQAATAAARELMDRGARLVLSTFEGSNEPQATVCFADGQIARRSRLCGRMLQLDSTLDATLAQMGKSTRFNLRYYRRRLERRTACEYLPDARPALADADLDQLNAGALNPVAPAEFRRRVESARSLPGSFLAGLRDGEGRWLSLVGGWRQGTTTVLFWQMNSGGWEKDSLGTVMRSYLLEDEIARGTQQLLIYGGTPHPMRHAFVPEPITDLVLRRRGLAAMVLCQVARLFATEHSVSGRKNYLASVLLDPRTEWVCDGRVKRALDGVDAVLAQRAAAASGTA